MRREITAICWNRHDDYYNVAVVTYDAVVLGCDSLSSSVESVIRIGSHMFAKDAQGAELRDAQGNRVIALMPDSVSQLPTAVVSGVQKMFSLYEDDDVAVAAVTSGMATLCDVTIHSIAKRFRRSGLKEGTEPRDVEAIANAFLGYVRADWLKQHDYENVAEDLRPYLATVEFLVAGFAKDGPGRVFRLDVKANTCEEQLSRGNKCGVCWAAQSNFVERSLRGVDGGIIQAVSREMVRTLDNQRTVVVRAVMQALRNAGVLIPEGLQIEIEEAVEPSLPWHHAWAPIDYANLSTQYAIELVELMVNLQAGMQRFGTSVPTVGGRTHIGVIQRGEKFRMLNEPELSHKHTGYTHDN